MLASPACAGKGAPDIDISHLHANFARLSWGDVQHFNVAELYNLSTVSQRTMRECHRIRQVLRDRLIVLERQKQPRAAQHCIDTTAAIEALLDQIENVICPLPWLRV